jgi:CBS domain-containing protein
MTVSDLMTTALITMRPEDPLDITNAEMKLAAIRHIPVVDERDRLVGIVSDRDILRALGKPGARKMLVRDIMTHKLHTIRDIAPASEAAAIMLENKIGALPVTGEDRQLVGMVTETDFLRVAFEALSGEPWDR